MEKYIQRSQVAVIIHLSSSLIGAVFFFVSLWMKGGWMKLLLGITIKNEYPLLLINSAFWTHPCCYSVYQTRSLKCVPLSRHLTKGWKWKTAFNTPLGHFKYLVMPFCLSIAPTVFQALVNDVLRYFLNIFVCLPWWHSDLFQGPSGVPSSYLHSSIAAPGKLPVCQGRKMWVLFSLSHFSGLCFGRGADEDTPR